MEKILNEFKIKNNSVHFRLNNLHQNLTNIQLASEWQAPWPDGLLHFFYVWPEFFAILVSKFNVSFTDFEGKVDYNWYFGEGNGDIILTERTLDEWLYSYAVSPWIREEHNLAILSLLYPMHKSFIKQMMSSFTLLTWILIIVSVIGITLISYIHDIYKENTNRSKRKANFGKMFFIVISYLLNQPSNRKNNSIALTFWSLMSFILVSGFTGLILFHILFQPMSTINTLDELIESNLTLITADWSYMASLSHELKDRNDDQLYKLFRNRKLIFMKDWDENGQKNVTDHVLKKAAYVREGTMVDALLNWNPYLNSRMAIAKERYFNRLIGFAINKKYTKVRGKIYKILEYSVEAGIADKYNNYKTFHEKSGGSAKVTENENEEKNINMNLIRDLFILLATGWTCALIIILFEKCGIF